MELTMHKPKKKLARQPLGLLLPTSQELSTIWHKMEFVKLPILQHPRLTKSNAERSEGRYWREFKVRALCFGKV
jgi:hypothetical protein